MELEPHLIDQVWATVRELFAETCGPSPIIARLQAGPPPKITWEWLSLLLGRILTSDESPALRKMGLYRLFKGEAGIWKKTTTIGHLSYETGVAGVFDGGNRPSKRGSMSSCLKLHTSKQ